jgi:hypothetical protein
MGIQLESFSSSSVPLTVRGRPTVVLYVSVAVSGNAYRPIYFKTLPNFQQLVCTMSF